MITKCFDLGRAPFGLSCVLAVLAACGDDQSPASTGDDAGQAPDGGPHAEECHITWREDGSMVRASLNKLGTVFVYRTDGRTDDHSFDERGLLASQLFEGDPTHPEGWAEYDYDAEGHLISAAGSTIPDETCTNDYDADSRLVSHQCTLWSYGYRYDAEGRIDQVTFTQDGVSRVSEVRYEGAGLHPAAVEDDDSLYTYDYDDEGRMVQSERDWTFGTGKDGTPDVRWTWRRRANGGVSSYEQDGTDHNDAPVIDGTPDLLWSFGEACDRISLAHPWLTGEPTVIDVGQPMPAFPF